MTNDNIDGVQLELKDIVKLKQYLDLFMEHRMVLRDYRL